MFTCREQELTHIFHHRGVCKHFIASEDLLEALGYRVGPFRNERLVKRAGRRRQLVNQLRNRRCNLLNVIPSGNGIKKLSAELSIGFHETPIPHRGSVIERHAFPPPAFFFSLVYPPAAHVWPVVRRW